MTTIKKNRLEHKNLGMHAADIDAIVTLTPALRRYARLLTRYNIDEADDLVQDALERALTAGGQYYDHGTNLKAWLMRIIHNRFLDIQRKKATISRKLEAYQIDIELTELININASAENSVHYKEIVRAFGRLPHFYRRALFLIAVEQVSYDQAAFILDVPVGTVKSRVARARSSLRAEFDRAEKQLPSVQTRRTDREFA